MKIIITPVRNLNAVRHNLSQPEEIEHVWLTLDSQHALMAGLSYGMKRRKTTFRSPDHYMFFSSRNVLKQKRGDGNTL